MIERCPGIAIGESERGRGVDQDEPGHQLKGGVGRRLLVEGGQDELAAGLEATGKALLERGGDGLDGLANESRVGAHVAPLIRLPVEEAAESWMAAEHEGPERTAEEISQLLYHAQVMMIANGIELDTVAVPQNTAPEFLVEELRTPPSIKVRTPFELTDRLDRTAAGAELMVEVDRPSAAGRPPAITLIPRARG